MNRTRLVLSALAITVVLSIGFAPQQVSVSSAGRVSLSSSQVNVYADSGTELAGIVWEYLSETRVPELEAKSGKYETADGPWKTVLDPDLSSDRPLQYQSEGCFISFKPVTASRPPLSSLTNERTLSYNDAFADGIGLIVDVSRTHWRKLIIIESLKSLGDLQGEYAEFVFEVETDFEIQPDKHYAARLGENSYIEIAQAWDSAPRYDEDGNDTENKIRIECVWSNVGGKTYLTKRIPTEWLAKAVYPVYTDTDIAWGSASEFEDGSTRPTYGYSSFPFISCCAIDTNKFVVGYYDDGDAEAGKARCGTVSGTTITWGDISEFCSDVDVVGGSVSVCALGTDKFVVVYADDAAGDDGFARVGTVSTRTISWGTAKEFETGDTELPHCCQLGTDKFAIVYNDEANGDSWTVCVCTVSTTTITSGTPAVVNDSDYYNVYRKAGICKLDTDKFAVMVSDTDWDGMVYAITVSGTDCTVGDGVEIEDADCKNCGLAQLDTDTFVAVWATGGNILCNVCTVSTRTITKNTEYDSGFNTYDSGVDSIASAAVGITDVDSTHFIIAFKDNDDSRKGKSAYCTVSGTVVSFGSAETFNDAATAIPEICILTNPAVAVCCYCDDDDATDHGEAIAGTLPSAATPDISNTPSTENLGTVAPSTTVYAYGSAPSNPVADGECTFTVTNNSGAAVDIDIKGANWTGGVGWTLASAAPGSNETRITAYYSGQNPASGVVLTTSDQAFITGLADSATKKWDFKVETGTFTDGVQKSTTITLTASLS